MAEAPFCFFYHLCDVRHIIGKQTLLLCIENYCMPKFGREQKDIQATRPISLVTFS